MMNNFAYVDAMKRIFTPGTRIQLIKMKDENGLPAGSLGYVDFIDDAGQIQMKWDNHSSLALIYGVDEFNIVPDECGTKYVIKGEINHHVLYYKKVTKEFMWNKSWDIPNCSTTIDDATLFNTMESAVDELNKFESSKFKIYPVCPRCHHEYENYCAISRIDNKTQICEKCGLQESLLDFFKYINKKNTMNGILKSE